MKRNDEVMWLYVAATISAAAAGPATWVAVILLIVAIHMQR